MINKEQTMRRLIHAAIRGILFEEDPVPLHVTVMAAHDMLRYYVQVKRLPVNTLTSMIKPEHQKQVMDKLNEGYNFLKHARTDVDGTYDEAHLHEANKSATLVNCIMFGETFGYSTVHMKVFGGYQAMEHPEFIADGAARERLMREADIPAAERSEVVRDLFELWPQLKSEREEDTALAHTKYRAH
jgi:hypothetical protein